VLAQLVWSLRDSQYLYSHMVFAVVTVRTQPFSTRVSAVWCLVYVQVDAIVYLVDAADRERFPESQRELAGLLSDDGLAGVPFLILGNKIDLPYAGRQPRWA